MEDWEDWGLAIGISAILTSCFLFVFIRTFKRENNQQSLLDNPV